MPASIKFPNRSRQRWRDAYLPGGILASSEPTRHIWAHVEGKVSRKLVIDKANMKRLAISALRSLQNPPAKVARFSGRLSAGILACNFTLGS
ncbi:hypothetical protein [Pseudoduganella aquatica]|uniref:Uncharacterized protein n=1 Tax=Pseudoduganella aquatica TaxID=2660641 RepID=A0A7X4HC93_9BURK|nr:hypothetical protein [Pseudoduganella aquatica]MYN08549.1 hypothetical protein [Pseudoduganella aquatica]